MGGGHDNSSLSDISLKYSLDVLMKLGVEIEINKIDLNPNVKGLIQQSKLTNSVQDHGPRDLRNVEFTLNESIFERSQILGGVPSALFQKTHLKL